MIAVRLVMFSAFDLDEFLPIVRQALGHGVSGRADSEAITTELHNILCVAGMIDGEPEDVESLYHLAYLIAADDRDMPDILRVCAMPYIVTDSQTRGLQLALVSGPIIRWASAIRRGCIHRVSPEIRQVFNMIYTDLTNRSLEGILGRVRKESQSDGTFLLESK